MSNLMSRWARASNEFHIAQDIGELHHVWERVKALAPENVLEIGSYCGGWIYLVAGACPVGAHLLGIDLDNDPQKHNLWERVIRALGDEGKRAGFVNANSRERAVIEDIRRAMPVVDVLHIDGDHDPRACREDFDNYTPLVRAGGLLILHDIQGESGVKKLWEQERAKHPGAQSYIVSREPPMMGTGVLPW